MQQSIQPSNHRSGSGGTSYDTIGLSDTIPDQQNGYGTLYWLRAGIQNGAPDGMALVDPSNDVVQFLSYNGTFTASDGPANGMTSTDIGVAEGGSTPVGHSLQLSGTGLVYEDFTWNSPQGNSFGAINPGQSFVPIPGAVWMFGSGLIALVGLRRRLKK